MIAFFLLYTPISKFLYYFCISFSARLLCLAW